MTLSDDKAEAMAFETLKEAWAMSRKVVRHSKNGCSAVPTYLVNRKIGIKVYPSEHPTNFWLVKL